MKAAVLEVLGEVPRFRMFDRPALHGDEQLVAVTAASIKQLDRAIAAGTHYSSPDALPVIPGTDGVGLLPDGSRVYFAANRRPYGSMAERAPASWTVPLPDAVEDRVAAAIVNPALGAWLPLVWRGGMRAGETVTVLGASGASGSLAVTAAHLLGAGRVVAAGRRLDVLGALGADATIDLGLPQAELREAFAAEAARGIGLVVDYVWGPPAEALIGVLVKSDLTAEDAAGPGVRLVSVGAMAGHSITLPSAALRGSRLTVLGSGTGNYPPIGRMQGIVADILNRTAAGQLSIEIEDVPLCAVGEVWLRDQSARRVVLHP